MRGVATGADRSARCPRPAALCREMPARYSCSMPPWQVPQVPGMLARLVRLLGFWGAQDVVRAVAARAGRGHQQAVLGQREAVDRIHVLRVDVRQPVLLREFLVAVAGAAGARQIERGKPAISDPSPAQSHASRHGRHAGLAGTGGGVHAGRSARRRTPRNGRTRNPPSPPYPGCGKPLMSVWQPVHPSGRVDARVERIALLVMTAQAQ